MKAIKFLVVLAIIIATMGTVAIFSGVVHARLTGTNPTGSSADAFCVGRKTYEVCIDYLGNVVPTTANTQTLGTAALPWYNATVSSLTISGYQTPTSSDVCTKGQMTFDGSYIYGCTGTTGPWKRAAWTSY